MKKLTQIILGRESSPFDVHSLQSVLIMGVAFIIIWSASMALQNLATTLLHDLGHISIGILYVAFALSCLIAPLVMARIGSVIMTMAVGGLCYCFNMACVTVYMLLGGGTLGSAVVLLGSIVNGFGAAIIWVANGSVLVACSTDRTRGSLFGMFWALFNISPIMGNVIASLVYVLGFSSAVLSSIFTLLAGSGTFLLLWIPEPQHNHVGGEKDTQEHSVIGRRDVESEDQERCADLNDTQASKPATLAEIDAASSIVDACRSSITSVAIVLKLVPAQLMCPLWILSGIYMSYQMSQLGELIGTVYYDKTVNAEVFVTFGVAAAVVAAVGGKLWHILSHQQFVFLLASGGALTIALSFYLELASKVGAPKPSIPVLHLSLGLSGAADSLTHVVIYGLIGELYPQEPLSTYITSTFKGVQSVGWAVGFSYGAGSIGIPGYAQLFVCAVFFGWSVLNLCRLLRRTPESAHGSRDTHSLKQSVEMNDLDGV